MIAAVIHVVGETRSFERAGKKGSIPKVLGTKKRKGKKEASQKSWADGWFAG
jgi:hypothetical protein